MPIKFRDEKPQEGESKNVQPDNDYSAITGSIEENTRRSKIIQDSFLDGYNRLNKSMLNGLAPNHQIDSQNQLIIGEMKKLNHHSAETVRYINDTNKIQQKIYEDVHQSNQESFKLGKQNYRLTQWVLRVTIVASLILPFWNSCSSSKADRVNTDRLIQTIKSNSSNQLELQKLRVEVDSLKQILRNIN